MKCNNCNNFLRRVFKVKHSKVDRIETKCLIDNTIFNSVNVVGSCNKFEPKKIDTLNK
jgi:hypothetical protein